MSRFVEISLVELLKNLAKVGNQEFALSVNGRDERQQDS